jgi:hypothetical protein
MMKIHRRSIDRFAAEHSHPGAANVASTVYGAGVGVAFAESLVVAEAAPLMRGRSALLSCCGL